MSPHEKYPWYGRRENGAMAYTSEKKYEFPEVWRRGESERCLPAARHEMVLIFSFAKCMITRRDPGRIVSLFSRRRRSYIPYIKICPF